MKAETAMTSLQSPWPRWRSAAAFGLMRTLGGCQPTLSVDRNTERLPVLRVGIIEQMSEHCAAAMTGSPKSIDDSVGFTSPTILTEQVRNLPAVEDVGADCLGAIADFAKDAGDETLVNALVRHLK